MWTDAVVEGFTATQELVDRFNKSQSDVHVDIVRPLGDKTNVDTIHSAFVQMNGLTAPDPAAETVAVPAGTEMPALVQFDGYRLREMADSGAVIPAQSCINATKFDVSDLAPAVQSYYTIGGVQWPSFVLPSVHLMLFNANQFRKAGLDPAKPPRTLTELEAAARKLQASGIAHPISMPADPNLIEAWLTGVGTTLVSNNNGRTSPPDRATFYTEAAVKVFTTLHRMIADGLLILHDDSHDKIDHLLAVATGAATITFEPSSSSISIAAVVGGDKQAIGQAQQLQGGSGLGGTVTTDYRAAPIPGLKAAGQASIGGSAWYITSGVPEAEQVAAWKFSQYAYQPANQFALLTKFGSLPISAAATKQGDVRSFFTKGGLAGRFLKVANDQFANLDPALPGPLIGPYDQYFTVMRKALFELQDAPAETPSQILTSAENDFTTDLTNYNTIHR